MNALPAWDPAALRCLDPGAGTASLPRPSAAHSSTAAACSGSFCSPRAGPRCAALRCAQEGRCVRGRHGNRFALEAVGADIEWYRPDIRVHLGDHLHGGADPADAWQFQQHHRARYGVLEGSREHRYAAAPAAHGHHPGTGNADVAAWRASPGVGAALARLPTAPVGRSWWRTGHQRPPGLPAGDEGRWANDELVRDRLRKAGAAQGVIMDHSHLEHVRRIGTVTVINAGGPPARKTAALRPAGPC